LLPLCFQQFANSLPFLHPFLHVQSFVFNILQTLFAKTPGVGVPQHWSGRRVNQVFLGSAALPVATRSLYV
jgi:hypothetical protein